MPESVRDRLNCRHELIFLLVKQPAYWFDLDPIRVPHSDATQRQVLARYGLAGSRRPPRRPARDTRPPKYGPDTLQLTAGRRRYGNLRGNASHRVGHPLGRNPGDVWAIPTRPYNGPHFAAYPIDLPLRCIAAGCKPDGTVLDIFAGTGTTGLAAIQLGRRFTGIELSREFADLAAERLTAASQPEGKGDRP
jgi:site-specific DNA-methyltransferase (cytosine-N4-specific)